LLGSSIKVGNRVLVAEISAVDLDPFRHQVMIRKGSTSGVYLGQAVLDAHGVMGQVVHTTPYTATVLLITDASHSLPVQVLRSGQRTVAVGNGRSDALDLPYLPNNLDVREGDLLVTSGLGGVFPGGYPVATITSVQRQPGRSFAAVAARPLAQLDRSREVLLVWQVTPRTAPAAAPAEPADAGEATE
jgi:rod shape-determining protein MreC